MGEYICIRCGVCCSKFQPRVELSEAHLIAHKLGLEWEQFLAEYTDARWPGTLSLLIRHVNGACIFLKTADHGKQLLCSIHDFKPFCCLEWKSGFDRVECQNGLFEKWGLKSDPAGKILGTAERIKLFSEYLRSIK
jgi:Fe-S-cluster containining protein